MNNEETPQNIISKVMSDLGKKSHQKHPRTKEYFKRIRKIGVEKQRNNKNKK